MRVNMQRFPSVAENTVIRLRSVTLKERGMETEVTGLDAIGVEDSQYTNILAFQPNFKQAMVISERTIDEELLRTLTGQTADANQILAKPKVVTVLRSEMMLNQQKQKKMANLSDLFNYRTQQMSAYSINDETQFRVRAFLLGFQP